MSINIFYTRHHFEKNNRHYLRSIYFGVFPFGMNDVVSWSGIECNLVIDRKCVCLFFCFALSLYTHTRNIFVQRDKLKNLTRGIFLFFVHMDGHQIADWDKNHQ